MRPIEVALLAALALLACSIQVRAESFAQERHIPIPAPSPEAADLQDVLVHPSSREPWIATRAGLFQRRADGRWSEALLRGPVFCVRAEPTGTVWAGAWDGLHHVVPEGTGLRVKQRLTNPVASVAVRPDGAVFAAGPDGFWILRGDQITPLPPLVTRQVSQVLPLPADGWTLATSMGLYRWLDGRAPQRLTPDPDRVGCATRGIATDAEGHLWAGVLGGLQVYVNDRLRHELPAARALPSSEVRCVASDPQGRIWVGTTSGVARQSGSGWDVRRGRRWLVHDEVRALAFDPSGTAWIATAGGLSAITTETLTFERKAAHFHEVLEARHVRPPGIVEKCQLRTPGDLTTWAPMDDDNDGGYTALALAMESFRFAVTRDPAALAAARRAFAACEFLQRVTGTPGFLARTVVPSDWTEMHDPNETLTGEEGAAERVVEPRAKRVPVRWRPSADGRWLWKGDTSSDEITAHLFGYFVYHRLAADAEGRDRVREQVRRIVDHLVENGFVLRDLDGRHTRWGVWAPERLNQDPDWAMDRGVNSVELLSFLKLAHHLTGDAKYERHYRELIDRHHYDRNTLEAPNLNPAWRTYIDMELLAFAYAALLSLETDAALLRTYHRSFDRWYAAVRGDGNPFFTYLRAWLGRRAPDRRDLAAARAFLVETPLDLIRWDVDNTTREDVALHRRPELEHWQTARRLPPSEIGYSRTDQNPWLARQGDGGRSESDGVFWLLPYWMGRHLGLLDAPQMPSK